MNRTAQLAASAVGGDQHDTSQALAEMKKELLDVEPSLESFSPPSDQCTDKLLRKRIVLKREVKIDLERDSCWFPLWMFDINLYRTIACCLVFWFSWFSVFQMFWFSGGLGFLVSWCSGFLVFSASGFLVFCFSGCIAIWFYVCFRFSSLLACFSGFLLFFLSSCCFFLVCSLAVVLSVWFSVLFLVVSLVRFLGFLGFLFCLLLAVVGSFALSFVAFKSSAFLLVSVWQVSYSTNAHRPGYRAFSFFPVPPSRFCVALIGSPV